MCPNCLATKVDITEGIQATDRPPLPGLRPLPAAVDANKTRVKGADGTSSPQNSRAEEGQADRRDFIWTEPHSKRIKVKLKVQKEQFAKLVLQQEFVVSMVLLTNFAKTATVSNAIDCSHKYKQTSNRRRHDATVVQARCRADLESSRASAAES